MTEKRGKRVVRSEFLIPTTIFVDTDLTTFEAMVEYLKEIKGLTFREIGNALDRDERNIWTVYHRAKAKRK